MTAEPLPDSDQPLRFSIPSRHVRGRLVRLGPVLHEIAAAHDYPPIIARLLAEALVLTALVGSLLKEEQSQLTMQAQTECGVVDLLVCDYQAGALRGYVQYDADALARQPAEPSLFALFGKGYLAITFDGMPTENGDDPSPSSRYQGIVPLEGESLAAAIEHYFVQSEQLPTLIRIATEGSGGDLVAGGFIAQHLAEGEEGRERLHVRLDHPEWEHVAALAGSLSPAELGDPALPLDVLLWRLFHDEAEIRVEPGMPLSRGCRCSESHIRDVLARFPRSERAEMADDKGNIVVDCAFCSRHFPVSAASLDN